MKRRLVGATALMGLALVITWLLPRPSQTLVPEAGQTAVDYDLDQPQIARLPPALPVKKAATTPTPEPQPDLEPIREASNTLLEPDAVQSPEQDPDRRSFLAVKPRIIDNSEAPQRSDTSAEPAIAAPAPPEEPPVQTAQKQAPLAADPPPRKPAVVRAEAVIDAPAATQKPKPTQTPPPKPVKPAAEAPKVKVAQKEKTPSVTAKTEKPATSTAAKPATQKSVTPAAPVSNPKAPVASAKAPAKPATVASTAPVNQPKPSAAKATSRYYAQVGSFTEVERARNTQSQLKSQQFTSLISPADTPAGTRYRVRVGPFASREAALKARESLVSRGYASPTVIED